MADTIAEIHKLLHDERIKSEKLFQENYCLKMEIVNVEIIRLKEGKIGESPSPSF